MLSKLFGEGSSVSELKAGLDRSTETVRRIAHRVSNASTPEAGDFASVLARAQNGASTEKVDLETEMVALAEEQIHFETASRLLEKMYRGIRSSIREG